MKTNVIHVDFQNRERAEFIPVALGIRERIQQAMTSFVSFSDLTVVLIINSMVSIGVALIFALLR